MVDATMVGPDWLRKRLEAASPDLLREMVATFIAALMGAEADALCVAGYGESSPNRVNCRNGYRHRDVDTRVGTLDVGIPKLRSGSYFPDWLVAPRRRAEQALTSVVATCYLLGVSTRRMEKLVATLGIDKLSKSQVSELAKSLDAQVAAFRHRPLDAGPYTYCWIDALAMRVRDDGRIVHVSALIATGVNVDAIPAARTESSYRSPRSRFLSPAASDTASVEGPWALSSQHEDRVGLPPQLRRTS